MRHSAGAWSGKTSEVPNVLDMSLPSGLDAFLVQKMDFGHYLNAHMKRPYIWNLRDICCHA